MKCESLQKDCVIQVISDSEHEVRKAKREPKVRLLFLMLRVLSTCVGEVHTALNNATLAPRPCCTHIYRVHRSHAHTHMHMLLFWAWMPIVFLRQVGE